MAPGKAAGKKPAAKSGAKVTKGPLKKKQAAKKAPVAKKSAPKAKKASAKASLSSANPLVRFDVHCYDPVSKADLEGVHVCVHKYGQKTPVDCNSTNRSGKAQLIVPRYNTYRIVAELSGYGTVSIGTPEIRPGMKFNMPMHKQSARDQGDVVGNTLITIIFYAHLCSGDLAPIADATCTLARPGHTQTGLTGADGKCSLTDLADYTYDLTVSKTGYTSTYSYHTYLDRHDDHWQPTFPLCPLE